MGEINVCFQMDTDNRENFPSGIAFNAFRKQRDLFYEILRTWEENHLVPGWAFQIALGGKIRSMLTLHNDATNYYHIARLFKSQLLISCIQNGQQVDMEDDESFNFLKAVKHINPAKLAQLQKRLVTPLPSKNQCVEPCFTGVQEFFKDFILYAFNPIFYVHLKNCLVHEILELNETQFNSSEIEDSETVVDEQTRQNFINCLSSLRLLAKLLGFLVSLPYRSDTIKSKEIIATEVEMRSRILPSLNLHACLQTAVIQGKLCLTIPWIVKYLAMMDVVSLRLPYYKQTLELLYCISTVLNNTDVASSDSSISQQTLVLLKSTLNWLLELPNFPKDIYAAWQKACKVKELRSLRQLDKLCIQKNNLTMDFVIPNVSSKYSLDKLDIVNDRILRTCCPDKVQAVPKMPTKANSNNCSSNKHITPVSSHLYKPNANARKKYLELQLEEAFFHGQPASTRKTVDFVSERVASTCVKHICNTLLSSARETNLSSFIKLLKKRQEEKQLEDMSVQSQEAISDFKGSFANDMNVLAASASKDLRDQCEKTIPAICETRVAKSIDSLLAEDSLTSVKDICMKIATRLAMERISQWIQSHIVGSSIFIKDMEVELNRFTRNNTSSVHSFQERKHNPNAISPTNVIVQMRLLIWELLDNGGECLTKELVSIAVDVLYQTLNERADLLSVSEKVLYSLSMDLALFLVAHRPDLFTPEIQDRLIKVWSTSRFEVYDMDSPMNRLLSPRNVMLLAQPQKDEVWPTCGQFIKRLLAKNVLSIDALSEQCVALFRHEWPVPILKHLSKCLIEAISGYKASDESTERVKYLLGWIAETYHDIEFGVDS